MEEKERYELFGEHCIKDNNPDARPQLLDAYVACVILNEQDNQIKAKEKEANTYAKEIVFLDNKIKQLKQSQKQLAISELELVLNNFKNRPAYFDVARQELCLSEQDKQFIDFINNRIKELGGGENE